MEDRAWRLQALCRGVGEVWFSTKVDDHAHLAPICRACPVLNQCLEGAYREGTHQVYRAGRWWQ